MVAKAEVMGPTAGVIMATIMITHMAKRRARSSQRIVGARPAPGLQFLPQHPANRLLDLATAAAALLVEGDADFAIGSSHGLGQQAGMFALDVEEADLAEVEQLLVVLCPVIHPPPVYIVGQVIDQFETAARGSSVDPVEVVKINIVD